MEKINLAFILGIGYLLVNIKGDFEGISTISRAQEVYKNELRFPYGINFKYNGLLNINLDRVWVVTKISLPRWSDIPFKKIRFDPECPQMRKITSQINNKYLAGLWLHKVPILEAKCLAMRTRLETVNIMHKDVKNRIRSMVNEDLYDALPWLEPTELEDLGPRESSKRRNKRAFPVVPIIGGLFTVATELISSYLSRKREKAITDSLDRMNRDMSRVKDRLRSLDTDFTMFGEFALDSTEKIIDYIHDTNVHTGAHGLEKIVNGEDLMYLEQGILVNQTQNLFQQALNNFFEVMEYRQVYLYERLFGELRKLIQGIAKLSSGKLPQELFPHHKIQEIKEQVQDMLNKRNAQYVLALNNTNDYYDMKLVTFHVNPADHSLVVTFPVLIRPGGETPLALYEIETVHVPISDQDSENESYTRVIVHKPYIAVNNEYYIQLRLQELRMCKIIDFQYYCEELFLLKHKTKHTCESAIFFQLSEDIITENCDFEYFHNITVVPSVLDGGNEIILANIKAKNKNLVCKHNNYLDSPMTLPELAYVKVNRSILCNCKIEADLTYVLSSLSACTDQNQQLEPMQFTLNLGFHRYLELIKESIIEENEILGNLTDLHKSLYEAHLENMPSKSNSEIVYPFSVSPSLNEQGEMPETMKELRKSMLKLRSKIEDRKELGLTEGNIELGSRETPKGFKILYDWRIQIINTLDTLVTLGLIGIVIAIALKLKKISYVIYSEVFRTIVYETEARSIDRHEREVVCTETEITWIITAISLIGIAVFVYKQIKDRTLCKGIKWDNTSQITLIISNGSRYIPIKIKKVTGYAHLFKVRKDLNGEDFQLQKHYLWDMITTKWQSRGPYIFYKDEPLRLPGIIPISLLNKYRLRNMTEEQGLSYSIMIKQRNCWYTPTTIEPIYKASVIEGDNQINTFTSAGETN